MKEWLVCAAPQAASGCAAMDDTDVLLATDDTDDDDVCSVLDLARYPEEAAATLRATRKRRGSKRKRQISRQRREVEGRS